MIYLKSVKGQETQLSEFIQKMIDVLQYILPNLSVFDMKVQASHAIHLPLDYLLAITGYAAIYSGILMIAASLIFSRRELS